MSLLVYNWNIYVIIPCNNMHKYEILLRNMKYAIICGMHVIIYVIPYEICCIFLICSFIILFHNIEE
jgi:NADH:ubiquinone oxidoreductase subunit H